MGKIFHPRWTFRAFWWAWRVAFAVFAFWLAFDGPLILDEPRFITVLVILGLFIIVEPWGIVRSGSHDTLSETHWSMGKNEWSFKLWSTGTGLAYGWAIANLPLWASGNWGGFYTSWSCMPWIFVSAGITGWLLGHFWRIGRDAFQK